MQVQMEYAGDRRERSEHWMMSIEKNKLKCSECGWKGDAKDILKAPSPFDPDDELYGCPKCKMANELITVCEHQGCWKEATNGGIVDGEYKRACFEHGWCNPSRDRKD